MEGENKKEGDVIIVESEYKWKKIYEFLLKVDEPVPATVLQNLLNMSRTEFYNAMKWLRAMKLIEVELDPNDMRKHLYKAVKSRKNL